MEQDPLILLKKYKYYSWIVILGILVYANSLFNGFIWDDKTYIINNPQVHSLSWNLLFGQNWFNSAGFYRPIPALYFAFLYSLFSNTSFFYHIFQVDLHIVNTVLLFILFKKFFNKNLSFFLSLIFLVHPVNTESVSYIASSASVIFFFFGITALLLSLQENLSRKKYVLIFFLLLLSLMTKETGILFIFLVLLIRFIPKKGKYVLFTVGSILTICIYTIMRIGVIGTTYVRQNTVPIMQLSFMQRLFHIPAIIWYYLTISFFPLRLSVSQNWTLPTLTFKNFFLPISGEVFLLIIGAFYMQFFLKKNKLLFLFFFIWFAFGIGMLVQIVPLDMTVADRWMYFPLVGLLGMIGILVLQFRVQNSKLKMFGVVTSVLIISLLSFRTIFRNANWIDAETLYQHDIAISDDYNKEDGLAAELIAQGKFDEALTHAKQSVYLFKNFANVNDLGVIYQHKGNIVLAKKYYQEAISLHPGTISPFVNLATVYALHDNPSLAIPIIKNTLIREYPSVSRFWVLLAIAQYRIGHTSNALASAQKAYSLSNTLQSQYILEIIEQHVPMGKVDVSQLE